MNIDLHIHSKNGSDGLWDIRDIFVEAARRAIGLISITDHDATAAQEEAMVMAQKHGMRYVTGIELNVAFRFPGCSGDAGFPLDFLGYGFDVFNESLARKLGELRTYRIWRARKILEKLNEALRRDRVPGLTDEDMAAIEASAEGALARPHIAGRLIAKGIVRDKQEAFDRYLVQCNVPKMPLGLEEASELIRSAGGGLVLAHPGDPKGTSLAAVEPDPQRQLDIVRQSMLEHIDGIECWHTRHSMATARLYLNFAQEQGLMATGGSDCHQHPPIMGSVQIPEWVADQFHWP